MYRIDNATAVPHASGVPTPGAVGPNVNGYFTKGNPGTGTPATIVDDDWANAVQEEISGVIEGAGLTLSKTDRTQLLQALFSLPGKNVSTYPTPGTFAFTVPAGVKRVKAIVVGGGASGGGTQATTSSQVSVAPGGNAGCIGVGYFNVTPGANVVITVGAGGVFSAGSSNNGGTSSFGAFLSSPGGIGPGSNVPANSVPFVQAGAVPSQVSTGGHINGHDAPGGNSVATTLSNFISGRGADCQPYGIGGGQVATTTADGGAGLGYGAGGAGGATGPTGVGKGGGAGAGGIVIVEW